MTLRFRSSASAVIICRLVLNLRQLGHDASGVDTETPSLPELAFATGPFLGNIGAPLQLDLPTLDPVTGMFDEEMEFAANLELGTRRA